MCIIYSQGSRIEKKTQSKSVQQFLLYCLHQKMCDGQTDRQMRLKTIVAIQPIWAKVTNIMTAQLHHSMKSTIPQITINRWMSSLINRDMQANRQLLMTTSIWVLLVSTSILALISNVLDQFEPNIYTIHEGQKKVLSSCICGDICSKLYQLDPHEI